jgi:2'-5' RNA ligase
MDSDRTPAKTHKSALVLIPDEEIWEPIQAIRSEHDKHFRRWMPHITLLYPFRPRADFEAVARDILPVCEQVLPFELTLSRIEFFHHGHGHYTIWLAPEPKESMCGLYKGLLDAVPDCDDTGLCETGFTPHLTLGQVRGKKELEQMRKELAERWAPATFIAREVSLVWRDNPPDDVFEVDRSIRLGTR